MDRVSNDGYKSCRGLRIYSQALLWNSASCRRRVRALRSLSALSPLSLRSLSLALSSNATTLNHLIRLRGSQGIQIWKQRTSLQTETSGWTSSLGEVSGTPPKTEYRDKSILVDVTHADPQAQVYLQAGSANHGRSATSTSEARKRQHYARPGHVSFDERSHKLTTFAVESFGRLGG